jgi:hypothetical protein
MRRKRAKRISAEPVASPRQDDVGTINRAMIALAITLFVLTRFYLLFVLRPQLSDVPLYFQYAGNAVDLHQTPYMGEFEIEYPPLAWWTISAPRLLDDRRISDPRNPSQVMPVFVDYQRTFRGLMFLFDLASFAVLLLIVRRRRPRLTGWAALVYVIAAALFVHLLYDRLDVGLLMLLMLWAYSWLQSLEDSGRKEAWVAAAYLLLGLSISFKIIPIICVPFLLLAEFYAPRRLSRLTVALTALAAGIGGPFLIQYAVSGSGVFALFKHHAEREIQLESLYSVLMMIAAMFGVPAFVTHSHGAFDLSGDLSHLMKILSEILLFGFLAGMGLWALLRRSRYTRRDAYRFSCYIIAAAVILSNVLSPQYFIWAFGLLMLLALEIMPERRAWPWILGAALLALAALTTWIFPYHYLYTESSPIALVPIPLADHFASSPIACVVLGLRNLIYLAVVIWLGVMLIKRTDQLALTNSLNLPG